ncbi:MAG: threonine--tRNA ligase [Alphaproteobacteria bacterium]
MTAAAGNAPIILTLPDGSSREYLGTVTAAEVAADIGPGLAKAALAGEVDGALVDLDLPITESCQFRLITTRDENEALELIRHDAAHILAMAVQELFPGTQVTIGPVIDDGFYYDFAREEPFSLEDLDKIEQKMKEIVKRDVPTRREVWDRDEAADHFLEMGETYKAELIRDLPAGEEIRVYHHGDWHDLCRGPHLMSSGKIGSAFKLTKLAGAYWRGDAKNAQLQRIYGTAWRDKKELKAYLTRIEEAEKRDHRKLGKEMDLFHIQEEAVGMVFWHPKGWSLYQEVEQYIRRAQRERGYQEVRTPQLIDRKLWEASGHWDKFRENMFTSNADEKDLALKPMNCPAHIEIFKQGLKSYRELPLRMAEFGCCHRYEPSGALHGLMRVRGFTQDDAHIFCTEEQILSETKEFVDFLFSVYRDFGFEEVRVKFSDRPDVRAGSDDIWDRAEDSLRGALEQTGLEFEMNPGEGAFYGPKLEFVLRDAIGRDWQCGTLQLDFVVPGRLGAEYVGEDNDRHTPVMLHRAIFGSFERWIGILIENFAGRFPLWLAPTQAVVTTIVSDADEYATALAEKLKARGIRVGLDTRNEKINYKVREHSHAKIPFILVAGRREADEGTIAVRRLGSKEQQVLTIDEVVDMLTAEATAPDVARQQSA